MKTKPEPFETSFSRIGRLADHLKKENQLLRAGAAKVAASLGNGSAMSPEASISFLTESLAREVAGYCAAIREENRQMREWIKVVSNGGSHPALPPCASLPDLKSTPTP